jgi:norsolorinic acid ketoreductase
MVEAYLARPNNTVIAVARTTSSAESLKSLPVGKDGKLIVVAFDSRDTEGPKKAVEELQGQGITTIDTVIANAGVSTDYAPVASVSLDVLQSHVEVNAYGPLLLFQTVLPLLLKSSNPKFAALGTPLASIAGMETRPFPAAAYGMSKVMLHWMVRKAHFEHPEIIAFVLDPGFVQTEMGNKGAKTFGMEKAFLTVEDSTNFLVLTVRSPLGCCAELMLTIRRSTRPRRRRYRDTSRRWRAGTSIGDLGCFRSLEMFSFLVSHQE